MIPLILQQAYISEVAQRFEVPPSFYFSKRFKTTKSPDELIRWLVYHRDAGLAPMTDRTVPAPIFQGGGISEVFARGAFINEKITFTEEDIAKTMTNDATRKEAAEYMLLEKVNELFYRNWARREWLAAQVAFNVGKVSYQDKNGTSFEMDYKFHDELYISDLGTDKEWGTGTSRDPIGDCQKMITKIKNMSGSPVSAVMMNSDTLYERLVQDTSIRDLFKNDSFGRDSLSFQADPAQAIQWLFKIPLVEYDETFPLTLRITSVTDSSNFVVDDASSVEANTSVSFISALYEDEEVVETGEVDSVDKTTNTITLKSPVTNTFFAGRDMIQCTVPYLKKDRVVFLADRIRGKDLMEWIDAPFGFKGSGGNASSRTSNYGLQVKTWDQIDPDTALTRAQRAGLWAVKSNMNIGTIDVG